MESLKNGKCVLEKSLKFLSKKGYEPWWPYSFHRQMILKCYLVKQIYTVIVVQGMVSWYYCWSRKGVKVLSWIYRLGENSRVAEGHELPSGIRGHASPEIFWNEYALRCNLVHFETQFWEVLQWYFISFFSRDHVPCHMVPLDREYSLYVQWPRRVRMIFPI